MTSALFLLVALGAFPVQAQSTQPPLVVVRTNAPAPSRQSAAFALQPVGIVKEVDKLVQSGADLSVIKAFIQSWPTPYSVSADDILHLHDAGLPSDVLTALIQHGASLAAQAPAPANPNSAAMGAYPAGPYVAANPPVAQPPSGVPVPQDQPVAPPVYPVDQGVYSYPAAPVYNYYYDYPATYGYGYYPGVVVGLGFGFRGGYHGYRGGFGGHSGGHAGGFGWGGHGGASGWGGHGGRR